MSAGRTTGKESQLPRWGRQAAVLDKQFRQAGKEGASVGAIGAGAAEFW